MLDSEGMLRYRNILRGDELEKAVNALLAEAEAKAAGCRGGGPMTVGALTMSARAARPTEGPCRERHVLSAVMENKPLGHDVVDGG